MKTTEPQTPSLSSFPFLTKLVFNHFKYSSTFFWNSVTEYNGHATRCNEKTTTKYHFLDHCSEKALLPFYLYYL